MSLHPHPEGLAGAQPLHASPPGHLHPLAPAQAFAPQASSEAEQASDIMQYWRVLNRHKALIALCAALGVVAAVLYTIPQAPVYLAHATVEVLDSNKDFAKQVGPIADTTMYNAMTDLSTQVRIMQSDSLLARVAARLKEADALPAAEPDGDKGWFKGVFGPRKGQRSGSNLKVKPIAGTRIIDIQYESTDASYAADFINQLTAEYINSNMEARVKMGDKTREWMNEQVEGLRVKLERSEDALQQYANKAGLVMSGKEGSASEEGLRQIQSALIQAQTERAAAQSRYDTAKTVPIESLPELFKDESLVSIAAKLTELRREQAELSVTYTPKHEKVRRVEAQMAPLEAAFATARTAIVDKLKAEYESASRRERLMLSEFGARTHAVTGDAEKMIQYNILKRESDSNRVLYDSMLQRVNEASVNSAIQASNVRVVDPAKAPKAPYKPDFRTNALVGLLAGCVLGIAAVVLRDRADRTIQQPGDIQYWTNLNELGAIPSAASEFASRVYGARKASDSDEGESAGVELMTWSRRPSQVAEAFRSVLTSILFAGEGGYPPRVVVMTSGVPKEGKTTVSTNLSIALAEIRRKVLLVDADLRKPRMHDLFKVPNHRGLSNLLEEYPLTEEAIQSATHATSVPNLYVLPSGPSTHRAANLLYSPNFPELVDYFRKHYDMVIIDTPPMLGMTDARVAARLADGVILVMRAARTAREAAMAMRKRLAEDQTRVLGAILNDWNPKHSRSGYYGSYGGYAYDSYNSYYNARTSDDESKPRRRPAPAPAAAEKSEVPQPAPVSAQGTPQERLARLRAKRGVAEPAAPVLQPAVAAEAAETPVRPIADPPVERLGPIPGPVLVAEESRVEDHPVRDREEAPAMPATLGRADHSINAVVARREVSRAETRMTEFAVRRSVPTPTVRMSQPAAEPPSRPSGPAPGIERLLGGTPRATHNSTRPVRRPGAVRRVAPARSRDAA